MSTSLWWVFDLILVAVVIYVIAVNAKRGLTKTLLLNIGYVLTTAVASLLAAVAAPALYQTVAYDNNISGIVTANDHMDFSEIFLDAVNAQKYGFTMDRATMDRVLKDSKITPTFDEYLFEYVQKKSDSNFSTQEEFSGVLRNAFAEKYGAQLDERLPHYVRMYFDKQNREDPALMNDLITAFYDSSMSQKERADVLESRFAAYPTTEVLQVFIFLIIFSVIMVIVALISAMMQNRIFLNLRESTDHVLGGMFGLIEALAVIMLLTMIVRLLVLLPGGQFLCFDEATIADSKLFSFCYDHIGFLL